MRLVMSFASPSFYILRHCGIKARRKYRLEENVNTDDNEKCYVVFCRLE